MRPDSHGETKEPPRPRPLSSSDGTFPPLREKEKERKGRLVERERNRELKPTDGRLKRSTAS